MMKNFVKISVLAGIFLMAGCTGSVQNNEKKLRLRLSASPGNFYF